MSIENVVIIGAGPAGLAAARQLKLYGIDPLVYECDEPGGLLLNACSVINYPGVPEGISGKELVKQFPLPDRLVLREVTGVTREDKYYQIHSNNSIIKTHSVIIASGTIPRKITIPDIPASDIYYEVKNLVDGPCKSVAVIGSGDAALDYAMSLSSRHIVSVYARNDFSGVVHHLFKKAEKEARISLHPHSLPKDSFDEEVILAAVGRLPGTDFISENLLSSPPADGSFHMCGDCTNGIFRQTAIAVGNGIEAAMKTSEYLKGAL